MKTCRGQDVNRFLGDLGLGPTLRQMNAEFDLFSRVNEDMCAWARQHMMQTQAARRADKAARAAIIRADATDEWDELFGDGDGVDNDIAAVFQRLASEAAALASGQEAAATERSARSHARRIGAVALQRTEWHSGGGRGGGICAVLRGRRRSDDRVSGLRLSGRRL